MRSPCRAPVSRSAASSKKRAAEGGHRAMREWRSTCFFPWAKKRRSGGDPVQRCRPVAYGLKNERRELLHGRRGRGRRAHEWQCQGRQRGQPQLVAVECAHGSGQTIARAHGESKACRRRGPQAREARTRERHPPTDIRAIERFSGGAEKQA